LVHLFYSSIIRIGIGKKEVYRLTHDKKSICQNNGSGYQHMPFCRIYRSAIPIENYLFVSLIFPAWLMLKQLSKPSDLIILLGISFQKKQWMFLVIGILLGVLVAMVYRLHLQIPLIPGRLFGFALIAACIGASEELFFRGYLQGTLSSKPLISITISSVAHSLYKGCLFLSPYAIGQVSVQFLMIWTFVVGMLFGILKHASKSVVPPLLAHSLFDIWIYGSLLNAPWWVW
jgi:membrane protease YdiL (CAAX protease family)